jgi:hypothetical protein
MAVLDTQIILRGTRAAQPAAAATKKGAIYCVTNENNILERNTGVAWEAYSPAAGVTSLTGDVTGTGPGATAATIANDAVTNAKAANMAEATLKGRAAGDPTDLTANQASTLLDTATDPFVRTSAAAAAYTNEQAQDAVGAMVDASLVYVDATPLLTRAALTGDVTAAQGSNATTIANDAVTNAKAANMAEATLKGRAAGAGTGDPTDLSKAQAQAILGIGTTTLGIVIDGGGAVIATGVHGDLRIPFACTITKATLLADQSGSIVIDVWKDTLGRGEIRGQHVDRLDDRGRGRRRVAVQCG